MNKGSNFRICNFWNILDFTLKHFLRFIFSNTFSTFFENTFICCCIYYILALILSRNQLILKKFCENQSLISKGFFKKTFVERMKTMIFSLVRKHLRRKRNFLATFISFRNSKINFTHFIWRKHPHLISVIPRAIFCGM